MFAQERLASLCALAMLAPSAAQSAEPAPPSRAERAVHEAAVVLDTHLDTAVHSDAPPSAYDVVIRGGRVIDGSGATAQSADVAIIGDRIAKVGNLGTGRGRLEIDASGLYVTPGFINTHAHPEPSALPRAANMLTQGVTTEIANADGLGPADLAGQLRTLERGGLAVNIGGYIPFNGVWQAVMGDADRRATPGEIARMRGLVARGLADGAWGLSAGLDYKPGYFADTDEVVAVAAAAAEWRTIFPNHERLTPETGYSSRAGIAETLRIGAESGVAPVVTHIKVQGVEQGRAGEVLDMMAQARAAGRYVGADVYPYTAGQGPLAGLLLPGWSTEGGDAGLQARMADPATRARIVVEIERAMALRFGGPSGIYVASLQRELTDIAAEYGVSAGEAMLRLIETGRPHTIYLRFGNDRDVAQLLSDPNVAIACDCGARGDMLGHPRAFGAFPRVLGHYVREQHLMTWEEAVRRMTGLPATMIGMTDRGFIAPGMVADVTIFDPKTITERATYQENRFSEGVRFVLVNGTLALSDGAPTGLRGGRILRRTAHMPTRPMTTGAAASAGSATLGLDTGAAPGRASVSWRLHQAIGDRTAQGSLEVRGADGQALFTADDFGRLQTATGWASITGVGFLAGGGRASFVLIVDASDPAKPGRTVTLAVDGLAFLWSLPEAIP